MRSDVASNAALKDRIADILQTAPRSATRRVKALRSMLLVAAFGAALAAGQLGGSALARLTQNTDPISDAQYRQMQAYVALIAHTAATPPGQVWHELGLYMDVEAIDRIPQTQFDRALDWLDRRARRVLNEPRHEGHP
jgi:hypothetical protein